MTDVTITDEMLAKAFNAYIQAEDNDMLVEFRAGIEAIAPLLIAQGMERAAEILEAKAAEAANDAKLAQHNDGRFLACFTETCFRESMDAIRTAASEVTK